MGVRTPLSRTAIHAEMRYERQTPIGKVRAPPGSGDDYVVAQELKAAAKTEAVEHRLARLRAILPADLGGDVRRPQDARLPEPTEADLPQEVRAGAPPRWEDFELDRPSLLSALLPGRHGDHHVSHASQRAYDEAMADWRAANERESQALAGLRARVQADNAALADAEAVAEGGDAQVIAGRIAAGMNRVPLPEGFSRERRVEFDPAARRARIAASAPAPESILPEAIRFRYARRSDQILPTPLPPPRRERLYADAVARLALRLLHAAFMGSPSDWVRSIALTIRSEAIDPATGRTVAAPLIALEVDRGDFADLDLTRVDPTTCVAGLEGRV